MYKKDNGSAVVFLVLSVDDILIIGNDISKIQSIKVYIGYPGTFFVKDLGEATYILGIWIYRGRSERLLGLS